MLNKQIMCDWLAKVRVGPELHHFCAHLQVLFMEGSTSLSPGEVAHFLP